MSLHVRDITHPLKHWDMKNITTHCVSEQNVPGDTPLENPWVQTVSSGPWDRARG